MLVVVILLALFWLAPIGPRVVTGIVATIIGIVIAARAQRAVCAIVALGKSHERQPLDYDRKPSRAERRALAASLRFAVRQTEFTSLLPNIAPRARRIVMFCSD